MNQQLVTKKIIIRKEKIVENFNTSLFIMTPQAVHHNDKAVLLRNVTNLLKCECIKGTTQTLTFSNKLINHIYKTILYTSITIILLNIQASLGARIDQTTIQAIVWFDKADLFIISSILVTILTLAMMVLFYSHYERRNRKPTVLYSGLLIETKTGQSEGLFTQNKVFIETLFEHITKALNDQDFIELIADFKTTEITYINTQPHQSSTISLKVVGNNSLIYN